MFVAMGRPLGAGGAFSVSSFSHWTCSLRSMHSKTHRGPRRRSNLIDNQDTTKATNGTLKGHYRERRSRSSFCFSTGCFEVQITNTEVQITNTEVQITNTEVQITNTGVGSLFPYSFTMVTP